MTLVAAVAKSRRAASAVLAALALAAPRAAVAQEGASSADIAAARDLGREGIALANDGKCAEAAERLARATALHASPILYERLGECQVELGALVDAAESFRRALRDGPASPTPATRAAQDKARKLLATTLPRLGKLTVTVEAPPEGTFAVKIDNAPLAAALLGVARPTDPGAHVVEASGPGLKSASARVTLAEGGTESVALKLEALPQPPASPAAPAPAAPPATPAPEAPSGGVPRWASYAALGVGAVGVAAGATFGVLALRSTSELEGPCGEQKRCPVDQRDRVDRADRFATFSTVGFAVGAAGLAGGAILYVLGPRSHGNETGKARARISPWVGAVAGGVEGTF